MTDYVPPKKNDANGFVFYTALSARTPDGTFLTNPTLAVGDVKVSLDGGALTNITTLPTVTPAASGLVKVTLSQAEINADNVVVKFADAAGAEWCDNQCNFQTATRQLVDLATGAALTTVQADTDDIQTRLPAALVGGRMDSSVGAMAAAVLTAAAVATDAIDADALATDGINEIRDAIWDRATASLTTAGSIGKRLADDIDATISSRLATAGYTAPDNADIVTILGLVDTEIGAIKTQTDKLTFTVANQVDSNVLDWKSAVAPAMTGDAFARLGAPAGASVSADIAAVKALLPAALVGGKMDSSVGAMAAGVITAAAVATDAIDADAFATDAVTEIVNAVWANATRSLAAAGNNSVADALLDRADGIETGMTFRQAQRLSSAVLLGKTSGAPAAPVFRDVNDTANRVSATIAGGNRTAVTLTP